METYIDFSSYASQESSWEASPSDIVGICENVIISSDEVIKKIEKLTYTIYEQIMNNDEDDDVVICFNRVSSTKNSQIDPILGVFVKYDTDDKKRISLIKNPKKFAIFMEILSIIHRSLKQREVISKRAIFYQDINLFQNQEMVDITLEEIACCLEVPRGSLGVIACPRGEVAGPLQWVNNQDTIVDCSTKIELIPSIIDSIRAQKTSAVAILVVEKDTVFMRLVQSSIVKEVILVTGRGFPDYSTRLFVKLLEDTFDIPIVGLFDADPYGILIMQTYRFGSKNAAHDGINMSASKLKWLGIRPSEFDMIPKKNRMELNERDRNVINKMLNEFGLPDEIKIELKIMIETNQKAEIESIGFAELVDLYLPRKFANFDWI
ncbi:Type IIB DNA topoisomerase family protein [Histomonas meleagridis]|uniref:Type IIB DNA topoisomerase family protein n=1 Tax=Histomonas meleagridis TaxID=135588 RepID=UPI00355A8FED|nr:Type IIB DNA topoisomerase family protein [Histomonas meleagridis]KAH0798155.1 Type IIB DNA topoisomerase family protein [Histomonas meleagridis]